MAVCSADWHLDRFGRGAWSRRPEVSGDSYYALEQIVDLCLELSVDLYAAGDLIDTNVQEDPAAVQWGLEQLARLDDKNLICRFTQGQHEKVPGQTPWLALSSSGSVHSHRKAWQQGKLHCYALDFTRKEDLEEAFASIPPETDILLTHQVWTDLMGDHIPTECRFSDVPHAKVLLTGDYHKHLTVRTKGATGQDLLVLSPGSTHMRSLDEPEDKAVFVLYSDLSVESVPLKSRRIYRYTISSPGGLDNLLEQLGEITTPTPGLPPQIARPILDVLAVAPIPDLQRKLAKAAQDRFHLFLRNKPVVGFTYADVERPKDQAPLGLVGELSRKLDPKSFEYTIASRLLTGDNPGKLLEELEKEYLADESTELVPDTGSRSGRTDSSKTQPA